MNKREIITNSAEQTKKLGLEMAEKILSGEAKERVICLSGDLGAGKTTFTQGLLEGLGAEGPFVSPTFMIMKQYKIPTINNKQQTTTRNKKTGLSVVSCRLSVLFHIDAYRVEAEDILELGWEEMISQSGNVIIVEWAERIESLIPADAIWMEFEWKNEKERIIRIKN
ncbi:MAG: hypothetical protein UR69_C0004G0096 [Candidatus Moranbacteria bacterium GW2011_GWE2_35_2-]|nr:MAG: hypothetical protein UR69_C0004G0096 [Candidatus Moranbacteria bacterium GW2011_GWE2_35_2-]KKQ04160.1 MAG: hypothetical protein US15_C0066G0005 [Candidatus Moranbacteria bacterium GW2011_GWF1_36_4]KKQ22270.1 MAG: hypothetical protein US37_C0003G0096 [Candidatus Moranbacteria bacterium GW2011_GWF2_37_11]KKQ28498.1 MAG: hypothetical protein US44_C0010G0004 [Candidatus Moranbacteria bacterium GW2011_GWD1_37_17]KKQ30238.1 MAG: hypothetical protein US47_C0003G0033 [Candidatus Moranbacteria b